MCALYVPFNLSLNISIYIFRSQAPAEALRCFRHGAALGGAAVSLHRLLLAVGLSRSMLLDSYRVVTQLADWRAAEFG